MGDTYESNEGSETCLPKGPTLMHPFLIESLTAARIADLHDGAARRRLARAATGREARGVRRTPVPRGLSSAPTGTAVAACC